jgi:Rrf2 family protein
VIISRTAEYALRAVLHVAQHGEEYPVRVAEMAAVLGIPQNYLSKILHRLARAGVLSSTRGKTGGFQLAVPAERLALHAVIAPFDALAERRQCLLGRPRCTDRSPCSAHGRWKSVTDTVAAFFTETTVAELLQEVAISA